MRAKKVHFRACRSPNRKPRSHAYVAEALLEHGEAERRRTGRFDLDMTALDVIVLTNPAHLDRSHADGMTDSVAARSTRPSAAMASYCAATQAG
jgi:hypothetical protein